MLHLVYASVAQRLGGDPDMMFREDQTILRSTYDVSEATTPANNETPAVGAPTMIRLIPDPRVATNAPETKAKSSQLPDVTSRSANLNQYAPLPDSKAEPIRDVFDQ
jgi:hypothetical protein